jgi:hypothetical protein
VALGLGAQAGYSSNEKIGMPTVADQPIVASIVIIVIPELIEVVEKGHICSDTLTFVKPNSSRQ